MRKQQPFGRWAGRFLLTVAVLMLMPLQLTLQAQDVEPPEAPLLSEYGALVQTAHDNGTVMLIVGLELPTDSQPEGRLGPAAVQAQRVAIAGAQQRLLDNLSGYSVDAYATYESIPYLALKADESAVQALITSPQVASLQQDLPERPTLASSTAVIGAPAVWAQGIDGSGQTVVILDTGIDANHPFFGGRVVAEACYSNAGGAGGKVSLCPNGNPTQFGTGAADATATQCWNGGQGTQVCAHGSHVAGIAAGDGSSYDGVAPGADLIAIQAFTRFNLDSDCGGTGEAPCVLSYVSDQLSALDYVYDTLRTDHSIASINMSLGGGQYNDQATCDANNGSRKAAMDNLRSVGIATVVASGNDGWTNYMNTPGCISSAIGVGATTDSDAVASFSNMHDMVDLLAPGYAVDSSIPDDTYATYYGTSMATPHVAGAWALLKSIEPGATVDQILASLQDNGISVADTRPGGSVTKPRIQVDAAAAGLGPNTWLGFSTAWDSATNWSTGAVPTAVVNVTIPASPAGGSFPTINADASVHDLTVESGAQLGMAANTLNVYGDWSVQGTGVFGATGGTVVFGGTAAQAINMTNNAGDHFYNLQIGDGSTSLTVTADSDLDVDGDLYIMPGASLAAGANTVNVAGSWNDLGLSFIPGTSTVVLDGDSQTVDKTIAGTVMAQDFSEYDGMQNGYFTSGEPSDWTTAQQGDGNNPYNTWWFGRYLAHNPVDGGFALRWHDGTASWIDAWLISPALELSSDATYELQFKYRVFSGSDPQDLHVKLGSSSAPESMTEQVFSETGAGNTDWIAVSQGFSVATSGTYYLGFNNYDNPSGSSYGLELDNIVLTTMENLNFHNLTVNSTDRAVFNGDVTVNNDLTIGIGATMDMGTYKIGNVGGTFTNFGTLAGQESATLTPGTTTGYYDAWQEPVAQITPASASTSPGETTVTMHSGSTFPENAFGLNCPSAAESAELYWNVEATTSSGLDLTLRLYYEDSLLNGNQEAALVIWHCEGGSWVKEPGTYSRDTSENWVEVTGVGDLSPFMLTGDAPTAVDLVRFDAWPDGPAINVVWQTASEVDKLGFNLYRGDGARGERTVLNGTLIPTARPGSPLGAVYTWLDEDVQPGVTYRYWLEDVDVYGATKLRGPVEASVTEVRQGIYVPLVTRY